MQMMPDLSSRRLEREGAGRALDLAALSRSLYYYRRTALLAFAAVMILGVLLALLMPARYRSEAKLLALTSDYYDVRSESSDSKAEPFKPEEVVNLEMQLLSSHDLHRAALTRMGGAPSDPLALERAREAFTKALAVTKASDANVIELAFTDPDPQRARAALDQLIKVYQQTRAKLLLSGQAAQLEQQRDAASRDLAAASDALGTFQAQHRIADIDAQITGAVTIDTALRQRLSDTEADLSGARGSLARLRASAGRVPETVEIFRDDSEATKGIADMQSQILQLEAKRADLAGRYMPGSPLIVQADKQIAALRQAVTQQSGQLQAARRTGRNAAYDSAVGQLRDGDAAIASDSARRARLNDEIAASGGRLQDLNAMARQIAELKLRRDVALDRFRLLARQVDQARSRASEAMAGGSNVRVIQAANVPTARSNPRWLMIAGSLAAALVLSVVTLLLRAVGRDVVLDPAEAAADADAPVIADVHKPREWSPGAPTGALAAALTRSARAHGVGAGEGGQAEGKGQAIAMVMTSTSDLGDIRAIVEELGEADDAVGLVMFDRSARGMIASDLGLHDDAFVVIGDQAWSLDADAAQRLDDLRQRCRWVLMIVPPIVASSPLSLSARSHAQIAAAAEAIVLLVGIGHDRRSRIRDLAALLRQCGRPVDGVIVAGSRMEWPRFVKPR